MSLVSASRSRVLVVDDDVTFLRFVCMVIERLPVRTEVSMTGSDARRRIAEGGWAVVLLDLNLPDMHGLDVLRDVRARGDAVPVVVLTGAGTVPSAVEAMKLGVLEFLEKPFPQASLTLVVEQLLRRHSARPPAPTSRVQALARVVAAFIDSPVDARTIDELCRCSGVFVAPRTFRRWCEAAGVRAAAVLTLARLLRALGWAARYEGPWTAILDADDRTIRAMCGKAKLDPAALPVSLADFLRGQRLVSRPCLVDAIAAQLRDDADRRPQGK